MDKSLAIIGPRCSGKTTTSKGLAEHFSIPLVDADAWFANSYGNISEFVAKQGWEIFRPKETKILTKIFSSYFGKPFVLSPGGGAVAHDQGEKYRRANQALVQLCDEVIYLLPSEDLAESAHILSERLIKDLQSAGQRPSLEPGKTPYEEMFSQLRKRHTFYKQTSTKMYCTGRLDENQVLSGVISLLQ